MKYPAINDITTTPDSPPQFVLQTLLYPEKFASIQKKFYPDLSPLSLGLAPDEAFSKILAVAKLMPRWRVMREDAQNFAIEAVATTRLLRFKDDVVIEVRGIPGSKTSEVHMRSKSRLGIGDWGANYLRIQDFLQRL